MGGIELDTNINMYSPSEIIANYATIGGKKAATPGLKLLALGIVAGFLIGMGSAVTNTAAHSIDNVSAARIISGLLFPFGLGIVMLLGAELFTGNCMIIISVLDKKASVVGMLKNWLLVYVGNAIGAGLLALGCGLGGQFNYSSGELAVYTIKVAVSKSNLNFGSAVVMGIFCNILVCMGVLCALSAKDTIGKIVGAYIPVAFFVICGFEHCVANMYYIPAGLIANRIPEYAAKAAAAGIDTTALTVSSYLMKNLLPVTIGNILGGAMLGVLLWACYVKKSDSVSRH